MSIEENKSEFDNDIPEYMEQLNKQIETAKADLKQTHETHSKTMDSEVKPQEVLPESSEDTEKLSASEESNQPEYTEKEKEALAEGWDPKKSKSAERFLEDGSFFKKISAQSKKIDELNNAVKTLLDHNEKLETVKYKEGYERALQERNKAVEEGDTLAFKIAEEKLQQRINLQPPKQQKPQFTEDQTQMFDAFKTRNKDWFAKGDAESREMTELAVAYDQYNLGKGKSYEESIKDVEHIIKLKFPHRFENPKQDKPIAVLKTAPKVEKSLSTSKLSPQQLNFAKQASRIDKNFKLERYVKQLKETGALRDE